MQNILEKKNSSCPCTSRGGRDRAARRPLERGARLPETVPAPTIRPASADDADALLLLGRTLLSETDFFLRRPGERAADRQEMQGIINSFAENPGWLMLNAWQDGTPVAEAILRTGGLERIAHVGMIGIGVLRAHWGRGLGRTLMTALEDHAAAFALERLEFTVLAHNHRARDFYRRLGYLEEGRRHRSVRYGADPHTGQIRFADEVLMAKWIGPANCIDCD